MQQGGTLTPESKVRREWKTRQERKSLSRRRRRCRDRLLTRFPASESVSTRRW